MLAESGIYAIKACEYLANIGEDEVCPTRKISHQLGLSNEYLVKVFQKLKKNGIIRSQKGAAGGVQLNMNAASITLYRIIKATNPSYLEIINPVDIHVLKNRHDKLYTSLITHVHDVQNFLKNTTLKEFADSRSGGLPITTKNP
ncbi:RrF2 family transcriptional regulator [Rhodohalobacter halophilus]|uniref:RrF2 family transcriptional regulator n=1 Tax=Rhodohalobacter halophilus TaxID=1812810 RepID=UPI00083F807C|nr:Rrf2 family transcriptional regulator [Rhodohalobacter halophilus]